MKKQKIKTQKREGLAALLFLLPSLLGISLFFLFPFVDTVRRSFFNTMGTGFTGTANYFSVLQNKSFQLAAANTAKFLGACIPVLLLLSLALALLVHSIRPGGKRLKTLFLLPMAIPVAGMALLWQILFDNSGLVNAVLLWLGTEPISFMESGAAFWVLVGTYVWKNAGYDMVLWLAGLDGISESLYEAAKVDGAGALRCFRYITAPSLLPTMGLAAVISLLNGFKMFREAYLVAGPYPHDSIYLLQHLFNNWFSNMDISRLCAAAVLLCGALLGIILLLQRFLHGEDENG